MNPFALSMDKGRRENMEDAAYAFLFTPIIGPPIWVGMVLDGVGGHAAGEVASNLGKLILSKALASDLVVADGDDVAPEGQIAVLTQALQQANEAIASAAASGEHAGMASTAVCVITIGRLLYVAWVGDSRCYLDRGGQIRQLTRDHSAVQQLVASGMLDPQEAKDHPLAHTITRYLGQAKGFVVETALWHIRPGDLLVLCSDGLTDVMSDQAIALRVGQCLNRPGGLHALPHQLLEDALAAGTQDNVTVLCYQHPVLGDAQNLSSAPTLTGAYPAELAQAIKQIHEENANGKHTSPSVRVTVR